MLEQVRICKRYGYLINVPELAAGAGARGFPLWRKLTVCTSEAARHGSSRSTGPSCAGYVRPGSVAPRPAAGSGASKATARRTAIASCSLNAASPRPRRRSCECGVIRAGRCVRRSRFGERSQRPLLRVSDRCGMRTCASRSVLSLPSKADRRSARAAPLRCSDRACWNNRQVIPEILETYCNEKAEPRQKSTLDADSQRNHTQNCTIFRQRRRRFPPSHR